MVNKPETPFAEAKSLGNYEVHDGIRVFTLAERGEQVSTPEGGAVKTRSA